MIPAKKANIVFVDDDPDTLQMYALLLQKQDFYVHKFLSALDALAFLRFTKITIDLIITDFNMPGMDGLKFLEQVRKISNYISTPFIFLTAISGQSHILQAYQFGAVDYIQKPVDNDLFIAKIKAVIQSYFLNALKSNILLRGSHRTFSIEEIIAYCEQEQVNGYALIAGMEGQGLLLFEKGILKSISAEELKEAAAFERMSVWKDYHFLIARGAYNPSAKQFLVR